MEHPIQFCKSTLEQSGWLQVLIMSIVFVVLLVLYKKLVEKPRRILSMLRKQGISGPTPTFLLGNVMEIKKAMQQTSNAKSPSAVLPVSHDSASAVFPFLEKWRKEYGPVFTFSLGNMPILYVAHPDILKDVTTCRSLDLGKGSFQQEVLEPLLGQGIISANGSIWTNQKKIIAPELHMEKVKGMMSIISESTISVLNLWSDRIEAEGGTADIKVDDDLRRFTGDVISKVCFGRNYSKGEEIFEKLNALQEILSKKLVATWIPGVRYLPTNSNRKEWALEKDINRCILEAVKRRRENSHEKDLLQILHQSAKNSDFTQEASESFVVDNCKNIYVAGYGTTAISVTWCLMLLATNPEWQDRVRAEVLEICKGKIPDCDMLREMKQLTMIIHETFRLYSPVPATAREVFNDMKIGNIHIPKGLNVWTMAATAHTDPDIWGSDAYKFNPERFANGITGACKAPHVYMPWGFGARVCLGKDLAMTEIKMMLSFILSKFSFELSPKYIHSPILKMIIEPEHGLHLLVKKL